MKGDDGHGTVKTIRNRKGQITGYLPLLPRELSRPPKDVAHPDKYQEPLVKEPFPTKEEAREALRVALPMMRANPLMGRGPSVLDHVRAEIQARHQQARRDYPGDAARANRSSSTWRSIDKHWLSEAPFAKRSPNSVQQTDLQAWFNWLRDEAESAKGDPLSPAFIGQVARLLRASFRRVVGLQVNPAEGLELPAKTAPKVPHLVLEQQRILFGAPELKVSYRDRVMIGCGMGAGLRIGELLPFEPVDVHLDGPDPHLMVRYGGANHAPTKSRRVRRVELYEPGLGFWRIWMQNFYRLGDQLVFAGPEGGYQKAWAENFPAWAEALGLPALSSHIMRHTWAVTMLSGSWGYEPRSIPFVSQQLGHADTQTTERYYGAFEAGIWRREVAIMTGQTQAAVSRRPVTAAELLMGKRDSAGDSSPPISSGNADSKSYPRHSPQLKTAANQAAPEADAESALQVLAAEAEALVAAFQNGERPSDARLLIHLGRAAALLGQLVGRSAKGKAG